MANTDSIGYAMAAALQAGDGGKLLPARFAGDKLCATAQPGVRGERSVCRFRHAQIEGAGQAPPVQHAIGGQRLRQAIAAPRRIAADRGKRVLNSMDSACCRRRWCRVITGQGLGVQPPQPHNPAEGQSQHQQPRPAQPANRLDQQQARGPSAALPGNNIAVQSHHQPLPQARSSSHVVNCTLNWAASPSVPCRRVQSILP